PERPGRQPPGPGAHQAQHQRHGGEECRPQPGQFLVDRAEVRAQGEGQVGVAHDGYAPGPASGIVGQEDRHLPRQRGVAVRDGFIASRRRGRGRSRIGSVGRLVGRQPGQGPRVERLRP
ncbi:MAG: hypothetical protein ACK55I_33520, partial [bacterium]